MSQAEACAEHGVKAAAAEWGMRARCVSYIHGIDKSRSGVVHQRIAARIEGDEPPRMVTPPEGEKVPDGICVSDVMTHVQHERCAHKTMK